MSVERRLDAQTRTNLSMQAIVQQIAGLRRIAEGLVSRDHDLSRIT
jgi:hypothetical protein